MSMRLRLTLTMMLLSGAALVLFSGLVYMMVNIIMLDQIDTRLGSTASQTISLLRTNGPGQVDLLAFSRLENSDNYIIQLWNLDRNLEYSNYTNIQSPLDDYVWSVWQPTYTTVQNSFGHMRVLSIPIYTDRGAVGALVLAAPLSTLDSTRQVLLITLIIFALLIFFIFTGGIWVTTRRILHPLKQVVGVLPRILEADDLSRRIPEQIATGGEIGSLIEMINNMLARLEQLFSTQRRFLSDVSHELRTPLTVIKGEAGLLRRSRKMDEESLRSIESEVDRLSRMVGDLLLLGQAESGKLRLDISTVQLDEIILDVFQQFDRVTAGKIDLRVSEIQPLTIQADHDRIKQVLINLVSNAVQHTPAGGTVSISLRQEMNRAHILISDTGAGISADDLPHIFERFYRGEKSRTRTPGGGFGLGLSISYWIVRTHGGTIDVKSQEGQGTTFNVWLPPQPMK